jgi:hypothetical protein
MGVVSWSKARTGSGVRGIGDVDVDVDVSEEAEVEAAYAAAHSRRS